MKKLAIALALAIVLSLGLSVVANAYVDGVREQYEWNVPKINPENPAIVFDGDVDLEGEWKGAVCVPLDASPNSDTYEEITLWSPAVWTGGAYDFGSFDEMDDAFKITINTYYLWDDAGLYIASTCDNLTAYNGVYTVNEYLKSRDGANGYTDAYDYTGMYGHSFEPMIYYGTESTSGYHWPYFFIGSVEGGDAWMDYGVTSCSNWANTAFTAEKGNPDKDHAIAKQIRSIGNVTAEPDAEGYRHWDLEIFLPWEYLNSAVDENGALYQNAEHGKAGSSFAIGAIWGVRNAAEDGAAAGVRVRMSQTQGWANPDIYYLSATPAEKSDKVVEDAPVVEEPEVEVEVEVEEPEVEVEVETEVEETPAPSNPSTADVSVLFYALAAISAIGGISVFKRK
ncbi:MAG: hypothetical protein J6D42_03185 [Clostridia bacterium]|nr:hypothetical protein [Clostridia bacterium]